MPDLTPATDLAARVHQTLVDLGEWPNTVAKALAKAGARGRRNSGCHCPVAVYLLTRPDLGIEVVTVNTVNVRANDGAVGVDVTPTAGVALFVTGFDQGAYPDLIAGETQDWQTSIEGPVGAGRGAS